jgi:phospholipid/cholesterol/gamma-HCH transport system substrate-binding protein
MLTRFVRMQLVIFAIASVVGLVLMAIYYLQVPTLFGIRKITVTLELPAGGGLYEFSNVTYRGVEIGKVTDVKLTATGATATMRLDGSPQVPAELKAQVRSVSAIGEQHIELQPLTDSAPYLRDGSVIPAQNTEIPQRVGPMLDKVSALINAVPKDRLSDLLDESFQAFNGAGYDMGSLFDSSAQIAGDMNRVADRARTLFDDSVPLLDSQAESTDALRIWVRSLAGVTKQVEQNDPQVRTILQTGPGFAQESTRLLNQLKPTLPVLLANLTTLGQITVTYHASLEQVIVLMPGAVAAAQAAAPSRNPTGMTLGDFKLAIGDASPCTVGYLPPSEWRSPADTTTIDTPDGLYCKLPQDSPVAVRGARNYPCMGHPGKRAPTVEICDSDKPYEPLAMRPHVLGPNPIDPNLLAQGIESDGRVNPADRIYGPVEGTPMPPGVAPPPQATQAPMDQGVPPMPGPVPPADAVPPAPQPEPVPPLPSDVPADAPGVAPSAFSPSADSGPSTTFAQYDLNSGKYVAADGQVYVQRNLAAPAKTWEDLVLSNGDASA